MATTAGASEAGARRLRIKGRTLLTLAGAAALAWMFGPYLLQGQVLGLIGLLLGLVLTLLVHEAGHLLAGRLVGYRWALIVLGPLQITRTVRGYRFALNRTPVSGGVLSLPAGESSHLPRRMLLTTAGGPAASAIVGAAAFATATAMLFTHGIVHYSTAGGRPYSTVTIDPTYATLWTSLISFGGLSLAIALINLVPFRFSGFSTDGMKIVELLGGGSRAGRLCALERIAGAELIGLQRPRHWGESWIRDALSRPDGSYTHILANRLAYFWALDRGDVEAAASFLAQVIEQRAGIPKHILPGFLLENAYFQARHGSDPLTARAWFEQAGSKTLEIHTRCRAQSAVLLAEGRIEEARECASRGLAALDSASPAGRVVAEEDWLREIERAACSAAPAGGSQPTAHG